MGKGIDLVVVNPGNRRQIYGELGSSLSGIEPPISAGLLAAFIRKYGYSVRIIDADAENLSPEDTAERIREYNPLLLNIVVAGTNPSASSTPKMTAVGEILTSLRKKSQKIKVALSGIHPSSLPERTLREEKIDFVCRGENFSTILQLLELLKSRKKVEHQKIRGLWYIKDNEIVSNGWGELVKNLDELPFVAWDLLPMEKYRAHNWHCFENIKERQPYAAMYTSLGCPFNCSYCNIHALYDGKPGIRFRSPENVVEEIDFLVKNYKIKNIKIIDELFVLREERVNRICDLIIKRGYDLNIWAYARVDTIREPILKKMKQAGINWLAFGIESASKKVREGVVKKIRQEAIKRAVEMTQSAGIYVIGNFIFGLPDDNFETMQETLNMAKELNCEYANFYVAMAYPGSQLYEDALKKGIKLPKEWYGYSQYSEETLALPTKYLSSPEVLRFRDEAFVEYFSNPKYIEMIKEKFGPAVVEHIKKMLEHKMQRKFKA